MEARRCGVVFNKSCLVGIDYPLNGIPAESGLRPSSSHAVVGVRHLSPAPTPRDQSISASSSSTHIRYTNLYNLLDSVFPFGLYELSGPSRAALPIE